MVAQPLVALRIEHPRMGPRKLHAFLARQHPEMKRPAASIIGDLLRRKGLVK